MWQRVDVKATLNKEEDEGNDLSIFPQHHDIKLKKYGRRALMQIDLNNN